MPTVEQESLDIQKKINNFKSSSTLFVILIVILLLADYVSLYNYGIELKNFKYLINYQELLLINASIISILGLIALITRRVPVLFIITFIILLTYNLYSNSENKDFIEILFLSFVCGVIILIILGKSKIYNAITDIPDIYIFIIINIVLSILISFILYFHFGNTLNYKWNNINYEEGKYNFIKDSNVRTFFSQKLFSTNKLERLQNNIEFINSQLFVEELIDKEILKNNTLNYKDFYVHYLPNDKYQSFFIVKDKNVDEYTNKYLYKHSLYEDTSKQENVFLYIILTQKYEINKFQVIDIIQKELKVKSK
ncbi:hypothetical protein H0A43_03270 [Arcobacter lanthieri]|uniref:hypothetical protein n=1 Tax=Aliarcobacter lanthieri TaxID=1355374 RepID=UPI001924CEE0|nr:hypothetical protein [Aliarcobacter lanthieri]MBL3519477.1 hypothetical protein [Aliarcobacter lanthieri]